MIERIKKNKNIFFNSGKTKIRKVEKESEKQSQKNYGLILEQREKEQRKRQQLQKREPKEEEPPKALPEQPTPKAFS